MDQNGIKNKIPKIKKDDLPDEFEKIYTYQSFNRSKKVTIQSANSDAFLFKGCLVRITVKGFDARNHQPTSPLVIILFLQILSSLYKYENKITMVHFKVLRNVENSLNLTSKS